MHSKLIVAFLQIVSSTVINAARTKFPMTALGRPLKVREDMAKFYLNTFTFCSVCMDFIQSLMCMILSELINVCVMCHCLIKLNLTSTNLFIFSDNRSNCGKYYQYSVLSLVKLISLLAFCC